MGIPDYYDFHNCLHFNSCFSLNWKSILLLAAFSTYLHIYSPSHNMSQIQRVIKMPRFIETAIFKNLLIA